MMPQEGLEADNVSTVNLFGSYLIPADVFWKWGGGGEASRLTCIQANIANKMSTGIESQDETNSGKKRSCNIHSQNSDLELGDAVKVDCFASWGGHNTDFRHDEEISLSIAFVSGGSEQTTQLAISSRRRPGSIALARKGMRGWSELNLRAACLQHQDGNSGPPSFQTSFGGFRRH